MKAEKSAVRRLRLQKLLTPYLLLLPSILLIGIFKIYPIFYAFVASFFKAGKGGHVSFVFFKNYLSVFSEDTFANSVWITLKFCVVTTVIQVIVAIILALFLNRSTRTVRICRTLIYIPVSINMVIACTIWNMFFSESTGLANTFLEAMGLPGQPWLTSSKQALWVLLFICCWKGISYWMMFLLAGLQNIDDTIYEAGLLDGTNYFTQLFYLTLPLLKNQMLFVIVSDTLINMFMFAPVYLLTDGGPSMSTDTLMYEAYRSAFSYSNYPRAYVMVTVMMVMAIVIASFQFFFMRDKDAPARRARRKEADAV